MNDSQQLRESMWDLVYGLVSQQEEQQLIDRIKSDPNIARLYAEVRLEADLVGQAAKVEDASFALRAVPSKQNVRPAVEVVSILPTVVKKRAARFRIAPTLLAAAATALMLLVAVGVMWPTKSPTQLARNVLGIDVLSAAALPAGLTGEVQLRTYFIAADGKTTDTNADLEMRLVATDGHELLRRSVKTDESGQATVEIPGAAIEPGAQVEVSPSQTSASGALAKNNQGAPVVANLPVQPEPQMAYFLVSEPMVEEGKPIEVSLWNFAAFSATPAPADAGTAMIEEAEGIRLREAEASPTVPGVLNAVVDVQLQPADQTQAKESSAKLRREADKSRMGERLAGGQRAGGTVAGAKAPAQPDEALSVPQQGQNQTVLERSAPRRAIVQNRAANVQQQTNTSLDFGGQNAPSDGEVPTISAGQSIKFRLPPNLLSKEIVATATCRGVTVATVVHGTTSAQSNTLSRLDKSQATGPEIILDLPPEADGLIEVSLYDRTSQEPVLVDQRQVYRQPLKQLQIEVAKGKARFSPGEQVNLELRVTDETGRPAASARLGVRVWNELSVQQSEETPVLLADAVRNGYLEAAQQPQQQPNSQHAGENAYQRGAVADVYRQSAQPYGNTTSVDRSLTEEKNGIAGKDERLAVQERPIQADLQLADQEQQKMNELPAVRPAEDATAIAGNPVQVASDRLVIGQTIELGSNREAVQQSMNARMARAENEQRQVRTTIGTMVILGGTLLLVAVGVGALRRLASMPVLLPAGAVSLACMVVGFMWTMSSKNWHPDSATVASRSIPTATAESDVASSPVQKLNESMAASPSPTSVPAVPQAGSLADAAGAAAPLPANEPRPDTHALALEDAKRLQGKKEDFTPAGPLSAGGPAGFGGAAPPAVTESTPQLATGSARAAQPAGQVASAGEGASQAQSFAARGRGGFAGRANADPEAKNKQTAPSAIYFNPQLVTDAEGRATVQLVMPPVESEYRVLIDALGQGRVGSQQDQLIIEDGAAAAKAPVGAK